jgi:hypothetical protein
MKVHLADNLKAALLGPLNVMFQAEFVLIFNGAIIDLNKKLPDLKIQP